MVLLSASFHIVTGLRDLGVGGDVKGGKVKPKNFLVLNFDFSKTGRC